MVPSGARDRRLDVENPGPPLADGDGGFTETWTAASPATVWAAIDPIPARDLERVQAGTQIATASHTIRLLYHPEVSVMTRFRHGARVFQVQAVQNPGEANRDLVVVATEIV